jgi:hypothetical protein
MPDADALLRPAHDAAYRFPPAFPGFIASVRVHTGQTGSLTVRDKRDLDLALPDGNHHADWVHAELASMVAHRWASDYAEGDGRWRKEVDGDRITLTDDPFDSTYHLRDGHIAQVQRTAGEMRFAIVVHDRESSTDGRQIPIRFTVTHWIVDPQPGRLIRADHYRDAYVLVDGIHLPARREVTSATDEGIVTRYVELSNHALLHTTVSALT